MITIIFSWKTLYVITVSDIIRSGEQTRSNDGSTLNVVLKKGNFSLNYSEMLFKWSQ